MTAAFLFLADQFRTFLSAWEGVYAWRLCRFSFDKNFPFCGGSIGELALCIKKKCIATYSVSGLWDRG